MLVLCLVGAYFFVRGKGNGKYTGKMEELVDLLSGKSYSDAGQSGEQRLRFYRAAFQEIPMHPLFGTGVGGWSTYFDGFDNRDYPHNILLEVSVEEGLVGLIALLFFLGIIFSDTRSLLNWTGNRFVFLFGTLLFTVCAAMFSGDLDDDRVIWLWAGMILAVIHFVRVQASLPLLMPRAVAWLRSRTAPARAQLSRLGHQE
jgi:O-antigen ligase